LNKSKGLVSVVAITLVLLIAYADVDWLYPYMLFFLGTMMVLYGIFEIKDERKGWAIISFISAFLIFGWWTIRFFL